MTVRTEKPQDYEAVFALVKAAFESAEHSDGCEHELTAALRTSSAFVPELSLVAEINGEIVGHIMFTKLHIGDYVGVALAPLSVLPPWQRRGVGMALINEGHARAKRLGYGYSVVLGSEHYYPRAGYRPAKEFGIEPPFDAPPENFMAVRLREDAPPVSGVVQYAKEFGLESF